MIGAIIGYIILGIVGVVFLSAIVWIHIQIWCREVAIIYLLSFVTVGLIVLGLYLITGFGAS